MTNPTYRFDLDQAPPTSEALEEQRLTLGHALADHERALYGIGLFDVVLVIAIVLAFSNNLLSVDQLNTGTLLVFLGFAYLTGEALGSMASRPWPRIIVGWVFITALISPFLNVSNVIILMTAIVISASLLEVNKRKRRIEELREALVELEPVSPKSHRNLLLRLGEDTPPAMEMPLVRNYFQAVARLHREPVVGEVKTALAAATALRDPNIDKAEHIYRSLFLSGVADSSREGSSSVGSASNG